MHVVVVERMREADEGLNETGTMTMRTSSERSPTFLCAAQEGGPSEEQLRILQ